MSDGGHLTEIRTAEVRTFDTGATRSPLGDKLCYSRFFDPRVLKLRAEYMHRHRTQTDGKLREPDNWKRGIDQASYVDSLMRHFMDVWLWAAGYQDEMTEDIKTAIIACMFNLEGLLHEIMKEEAEQRGGME